MLGGRPNWRRLELELELVRLFCACERDLHPRGEWDDREPNLRRRGFAVAHPDPVQVSNAERHSERHSVPKFFPEPEPVVLARRLLAQRGVRLQLRAGAQRDEQCDLVPAVRSSRARRRRVEFERECVRLHESSEQ